jgi:16S rRNA (guanine966-N2)-methyltransferase
LVENDRTALAVIRNNLARTHLAAQVRLLTGDVRHVWPQLLAAGPFAIIFLDPPYRLAAAAMTASGPDLARLLRPGGRVVLEHDAAEPAPIVTNLQLVRSCQYGTAMLSFYTGDCDRKGEPRCGP